MPRQRRRSLGSSRLAIYEECYACAFGKFRLPLISHGTAMTLEDPDLNTMSGLNARIFVSGSDVYVSCNDGDGYGNTDAFYWKNGVKTLLQISGYSAYASSLYISGGDVYVAGEDWYL
jgi:hypothetical protein